MNEYAKKIKDESFKVPRNKKKTLTIEEQNELRRMQEELFQAAKKE